MLNNLDLQSIREKLQLPDGFLGELSQIGIVSNNLSRTVKALRRIGIGPWRVYTFGSDTCTDMTYMGESVEAEFKIALAHMPGLMWEVIQPINGPNIYTDFMKSHGEGFHHLLFKCNGFTWQEKVSVFEAAGYRCIQSGKWHGGVRYAYYDTDKVTNALIEITDIPEGWQRPLADEVY